jgi:hypothetical protein
VSFRAAALLAVLTIGFYWKLTLSRDYTFLDSPDLAYMTVPWYQFQARAFQRGEFPLWDPHQWCGQPVVGQMQPGAQFPLNWPLFLAPLRDGRINLDLWNWHFAFLHWLAALFMYAYCRELGRGRFASALAGCAFSFGGFVGGTTWPQVMNGAVWMPLIFLFYHRAGRAASRLAAIAAAAGCGASIGMALLAGHHQAPMLEILAVGGVFLFHLLIRQDRLRRIGLFAVTGVFAFLVGAALLLPAFEYGSRAYRWVNLREPVRLDQMVPYMAQQNLALRPMELLGLVMPIEEGTAHPFVGFVPAVLAVLGIFTCWQNRAVRLHAGFSLAGLAYALGPFSIWQGVAYALVPFLNKGRSPGYAVLVFHFGLLVVAAHGADALFSAGHWQRRLRQSLTAAAPVMIVAPLLLMAGSNPSPTRSDALLFAGIVAALLAALLHARSRFPAAAKWGLLLLALFELGTGTAVVILPRTNPQQPTHLDRLAQHRGVIEFLRSQPGPFRVHADEQEIPYNLGDWEGLDASGGYLATINAALYDFVGWEWGRSALVLNQVYVVAREKSRPQQVEVYSEPGSGLKVFRNPDAHPRAWFVERVREAPDRDTAALLMISSDFDPRRETFLLGGPQKPPALGPCDAGNSTVEWLARDLHRVAVRARTSCAAMLVFADPFFPGWQAQVDAAPADLYAAYGALRGVVIPPGEHVVELVYRPRSVYAGAALSVLGLLGCLALALAARRESRKPAAPAGP